MSTADGSPSSTGEPSRHRIRGQSSPNDSPLNTPNRGTSHELPSPDRDRSRPLDGDVTNETEPLLEASRKQPTILMQQRLSSSFGTVSSIREIPLFAKRTRTLFSALPVVFVLLLITVLYAVFIGVSKNGEVLYDPPTLHTDHLNAILLSTIVSQIFKRLLSLIYEINPKETGR
eukprot:GHVN01067778.1.p1 GENE.GHVN01067778.1~~GHVN01067778.1.p1  ORF type:complete len:174 (-),score=8.50 GHVN01067778.1:1007-1528(-)